MESGPSAVPRIFISHSHEDDDFCRRLAYALRAAGADVWYDEHNMRPGEPLMAVIGREIDSRPICIVILSRAAMASQWVTNEAQTAFELKRHDHSRIMLFVAAGQLERSDVKGPWVLMWHIARIEAADLKPHPADEAIRRTLRALQTALPDVPWKPLDDHPMLANPTSAGSADALIDRGISLLDSPNDALSCFQQALQQDRVSYRARFYLGIALERLKRTAEANEAYKHALKDIDQVLSLKPESSRLWYDTGTILYKLDDPKGALAAFERAVRLAPQSPLSKLMPGAVRRLEAGVAAFHKAFGTEYPFVLLWYLKGCSLLEKRDYDEAVKAFEQVSTEVDLPHGYWYHLGRAYCHQKSQQARGKAEAALRRATRIEPENALAWSELGEVLGGTTQAIEALQTAIKLDPRLVAARIKLAQILGKTKRLAEAIAVLEEGLKREDLNTELLKAKLSLEREAGHAQAAANTLRQLATLTGTADDWKGAGDLYMEVHQYAQAESAYEQATRVKPKDAKARDGLVKARAARRAEELSALRYKYSALLRAGQREVAADTLVLIAELTRQPADWAAAAALYVELKQNDKADQAFNNSIRAALTEPRWREEKAKWIEGKAQEMLTLSDHLGVDAKRLRGEARRLRSVVLNLRSAEPRSIRLKKAADLVKQADALTAEVEAKRREGHDLQARSKQLQAQANDLRRANDLEARADELRDEAEKLRRQARHMLGEGNEAARARIRGRASNAERKADALEQEARGLRHGAEEIP